MASSGSINYTQVADDLIDDALHLLGVLSPEETVNSSVQSFATEILNKMIKAWAGKGIDMWAIEPCVLVFDEDTVKYSFADKQGAGAKTGSCIKAAGLVRTTFSADEAGGQTILSVTNSTGMASSDVILIELDDGSRHDTTISNVGSSTQITIANALPSAASSGNAIYAYTSTDELDHPREIMNVRLVNENGNEIPLRKLSRQEYMSLSDKTTEGSPYAYYYERLEALGQISAANPVLYIYTEPSNLGEYLKFDAVKTIDDIDTVGSDNFYFPDEYLEAITYNLAVRLAPAFGKEAKLAVLAPLAKEFLDDAIRNDTEDAAVRFHPGGV